jgi:hypothetical protein
MFVLMMRIREMIVCMFDGLMAVPMRMPAARSDILGRMEMLVVLVVGVLVFVLECRVQVTVAVPLGQMQPNPD